MSTTMPKMKQDASLDLPFRHTLATLAYRAAKPLRERGTLAGRGNRDLQIPPVHNRAEKEVAVRNVIDAVAGNIAN